jgi:uncharacterized Zn-binding protein involved in type VI secretion
VFAPDSGHDGCTIAEGNPNHLVEGVQVAYEGLKQLAAHL